MNLSMSAWEKLNPEKARAKNARYRARNPKKVVGAMRGKAFLFQLDRNRLFVSFAANQIERRNTFISIIAMKPAHFVDGFVFPAIPD